MVSDLKIPGFSKIAVITAYRPPDETCFFHVTPTPHLKKWLPSPVTPGDFNLPTINWQLNSSSCDFETHFCDILDDFLLSQLVDDATHVHVSILDLVVTNFPGLYSKRVCFLNRLLVQTI